MQSSLAISSIVHFGLLSWALFSFNTPKVLDIVDVEAVPISIVPIKDITQTVYGEKEATAKKKPMPAPTKKQIKNAQNVGKNKIDFKNLTTPIPRNRDIVSKAPPKSKTIPKLPTPSDSVINNTSQLEKPTAPATEIAALPKEAMPVLPDPVTDAIIAEQPIVHERKKLPKASSVPVPQSRITPARTARTPDRKKQKATQKTTSTSRNIDFNSDEITALLNKQNAQGGGAKTSLQEAGLGLKTGQSEGALSQSEMDALRNQVQKYWNIIPGLADSDDIQITVSMALDQSGHIIGQPDVKASGGSQSSRQTLAGSAQRAVLRAQPFELPASKYNIWSKVVINFNPGQFF